MRSVIILLILLSTGLALSENNIKNTTKDLSSIDMKLKKTGVNDTDV